MVVAEGKLGSPGALLLPLGAPKSASLLRRWTGPASTTSSSPALPNLNSEARNSPLRRPSGRSANCATLTIFVRVGANNPPRTPPLGRHRDRHPRTFADPGTPFAHARSRTDPHPPRATAPKASGTRQIADAAVASPKASGLATSAGSPGTGPEPGGAGASDSPDVVAHHFDDLVVDLLRLPPIAAADGCGGAVLQVIAHDHGGVPPPNCPDAWRRRSTRSWAPAPLGVLDRAHPSSGKASSPQGVP